MAPIDRESLYGQVDSYGFRACRLCHGSLPCRNAYECLYARSSGKIMSSRRDGSMLEKTDRLRTGITEINSVAEEHYGAVNRAFHSAGRQVAICVRLCWLSHRACGRQNP